MSKNPENFEQKQNEIVNENPDEKPKTVSVARQLELVKKYGITEEQIAKMLDEKTSSEEKDMIFAEIVKTLANAILHTLVDPNDVEDVSVIVGPRWGVSKEEYLPFFLIKRGLNL